jgi:hypothetical protein
MPTLAGWRTDTLFRVQATWEQLGNHPEHGCSLLKKLEIKGVKEVFGVPTPVEFSEYAGEEITPHQTAED